MNIKISELYTKCEDMAKAIGLSVSDRFVFDLEDDTSLDSIKDTFKGIESIITPGVGRYMVLMVSNEKPDVLMAVFPETEEGELKFILFDVKDQKSLDVGADEPKEGDAEKVDEDGDDKDETPAMTLDNFEEVLSTDEVEAEVNDFLFADDVEDKADDDEKSDDADDEKKDDEEEKGDEEGDEEEPAEEEPKDDEEKPEDEEPKDADDDDEGDDDEPFEVVDDEEDKEPVDEEEAGPGVATQGDGTPAEVGDNADKDVVVSEEETPADVGTGADADKDAKAEGVTGQGDGKAADVGTGADEDKAAKAEGVTGDGDGKPADVGTGSDEDKAGKKVAETKKKARKGKKVVKEEGELPPAPAPAPAPAADPAAAPAAPAITDPEQNIRDLIKYYTDELARVTQDNTVSTEVVSGIQEIIASLVANLESISDLEETEAGEAKAAAKAAKDSEKKEETDEVSEDGVPPAVDGETPAEPVADEGTPAAPVGAEAGVPVDQNVTLSTPNMTPDLKTQQADMDAATASELIPSPADATADLAGVELDAEPEEPAMDTTVEVPDVSGGAVSITTDAPVDMMTGEPKETPAGDPADVAADAGAPEDLEPMDADHETMIGPDGLPADNLPEPSDKFIDDQVASLKDGDMPEDQGMAVDGAEDAVNFVRGDNAINWSDSLYDDGKANSDDNEKTVPQALKELKEYAQRMNETVAECGGEAVNEVTIGRINKFCNLCATAYDTWHKIQDAMNASNELCEAMGTNKTVAEKVNEEHEKTLKTVEPFGTLDEPSILTESADDFAQVQKYIKSISHLL